MRTFLRILSFLAFLLATTIPFSYMSSAQPSDDIDVRSLQGCLKQEGASLDVLVLMDSSRSLRDSTEEDNRDTELHSPKAKSESWKGSDPNQVRGKILLSSLKLLRGIAQQSKSDFQVNLRNFGDNLTRSKSLMSKWIDWTNKTSDADLQNFVQNALFAESSGTNWDKGLETARSAISQRLGESSLGEGKKSCPVMFWITDGAPDPGPEQQKQQICSPNSPSSIAWFRQNNVLVLGGLLKPKGGQNRDKAGLFRPIVEGLDCGDLKDNWTRGSVVEADDVSALAWKFQKLLASLKNLIDLSAKDSTFYVDPGTSKLELYVRGDLPNWQLKTPDGKTFCSSEQSSSEKCSSLFDTSIGISTITIRPGVAAKSGGSWSLSPAVENDKFLVFGGIDVPPGSAYLNVSPNEKPIQIDEGNSQTFSVSILNADGSAFNQNGYQSIQICAIVSSGSTPSCKEGTSVEGLEVSPSVSDQSVFIQAKLVSKIPDRNYLISKSMPIEVAPSMNFATLACEKDPCKLTDIKNKNKKAISNLRVYAPKSGVASSQIYLVDYSILKDEIRGRGDGNIKFQIQKSDGKVVDWNDKTQLFSAGDRLILSASTQIGGASKIAGVIKYVSKNGDKEISRQLKYTFEVGNKVNLPFEIFLILGTYLLTLGLPYLFLLWMARRSTYLDASDNEIGIATSSFVISPSGKLVSVNAEGVEGLALTPPPHGKIAQKQIEKRKRNLVIEETQQRVELIVLPPKWNPFAEPKAIVNIPGSHVMTTVNGSGFEPDKASFTSFLANEAILHFESEPNLAPLKNEKVVDDRNSASGDLFASAYENKISSELEKNTGSIKGKVIYIVPFLSNRKKSLAEVTSKIISISEAGKLKENISELREKHLNTALENQTKRQQEESRKAQKAKSRKFTSEEKKVEVDQPAEDWTSGDKLQEKKNIWGDGDDGFPTSSSGTKLWE